MRDDIVTSRAEWQDKDRVGNVIPLTFLAVVVAMLGGVFAYTSFLAGPGADIEDVPEAAMLALYP